MTTTPAYRTAGVRLADEHLDAAVAEAMAAAETKLREVATSDHPFVDEMAKHLVTAGGKRFRPLMTVLSAMVVGGKAGPDVIGAGVAIELTHLSTLYHDDVMDEAPVRRGAESANSRWTNTLAILTGDYLFARASGITADLGTEATRILAHTIATLCEGQIAETVGPGPGEDAVAHHLGVLAKKTGSLIATCGDLGARLAGGSQAQVEVLRRFGDAIGVAFQISDDLIDVLSPTDDSGKTPGTDLREGIWTLPVLLALTPEHAGLASTVRLRELLADGRVAEGDVAETLAILREHPGTAGARAELGRWVDEADACLAGLPAGPARDALHTLTSTMITRVG